MIGGFVGRVDELAALQACAADAVAGQAWVVWVEGAAGAGKTALVDQALESWAEDFTVLRAEADEQATEIPLEVVGQLADLEPSTPFAAGLELVARWSAVQGARPLVVVVEDLHWADPRSREALLTAGRRLGRDRVLMVVTSRPDATLDGWERLRGDQRRCRMIAVGALSVDEVAAVCTGSGRTLPGWAIERLHRHTAGHALYVRTLLAELDVEQLTRVEGDLPAPRTLASTTVARLATLPADAQMLAFALAVLGRPVALALAGRVAGLARPTAGLDRLLESGLVTWRSAEGAGAIAFVPLTRCTGRRCMPISRPRVASRFIEPRPTRSARPKH